MNTEKQEYYFPKGYLLEMDRFLRIPHAKLVAYQKLINQYKDRYGKEVFRATAFGDFDLIGAQAIDSFPAYRQNSSQSYSWLGNQQGILLTPVVECESERKFSYCKTPKNGGLNLGINGKGIDAPFFGVTFLCVSSGTRVRLKSYSTFMEYCRKAVESITEIFNEATGANVVCEMFGTFHFAEIAILWTASQFVDILTLVEKLRDLSFSFGENDCQRVFNSSYTVISLLRNNLVEAQLPDLKGEALVQCTLKETGGNTRGKHDEIVKYIQTIQQKSTSTADKVRMCAGEHDLVFRVSIEALYRIFTSRQPSSLFNYNDENFQKNVEKTVTRLYYTAEDTNENAKNVDWDRLITIVIPKDDIEDGISEFAINKVFSFGDPEKEGINQQFDRIRENIQALSPPMSGILSTLDLLYSDYIQCVTGANDDFWLHDFQTQFSEALHVIDEAIEWFRDERQNGNVATDLFLRTLRKVFSVISTQISHITDAGRPYFDVTRPRFSRMEQVDLTLHAYYGIVKEILRLIYANAGKNQSLLVPIITLMPMTKVASELYFDNPRESNITATRLINLELPYDVWSYFHYHIPLLIHELYHFAAPLHRGLRNYTIGILSLYHIIRDMVESLSLTIWSELQESEANPSINAREQFRFALASVGWDYISSKGDDLICAIPDMDYTDAFACLRTEFSENLYAWFYGVQADPDGKAFTMSDLWEGFCEQLDKRRAEIMEMVDPSENMDALFDALRLELSRLPESAKLYAARGDGQAATGIERNPQILQYNELLEEPIMNMRENYDVQLSELLPDFAMVTILEMRPEEYLLQFAVFQDNSLLTPEDAGKRGYLAVRLGTVLDWQLSEMLPMDAADLSNRFLALESSFTELYDHVCGNPATQQETRLRPSAGEWFSAFSKLFRGYLNHYVVERKWMRSYVVNQIMPLFRDRDTRLIDITREYFNKLRQNSINQPEHFAHVIKSIRTLQKQPLLESLAVECGQSDAESQARELLVQQAIKEMNALGSKKSQLKPFSVHNYRISFSSSRTMDAENCPLRLTLSDAKELTTQLSKLTKEMKAAHRKTFPGQEPSGQSIWFRGVKDRNYHLLPSILVHFMEKEKMEYPNSWRYQTVHQLQREKYERFKYRADGSPEINSAYRYTKIDYLALMQHYSQWTTLLDWSEDAFTSLYFALEPHFKNEEDAKKKDAALYLFDPEMYNKARSEIIKKAQEKGMLCPEQNYCQLAARASGIPNLSISYNSEAFREFTCDDGIEAPEQQYQKTDKDPAEADLRNLEGGKFQLPLAIYTSQLSRRIRAQSGIFLAYSPETVPMINLNPDSKLREDYSKRPSRVFDYIALDRIQEYYLNRRDDFPNARPFLRQLIIRGDCAPALVTLLKEVGINRYRIYPELEELE